MFVQVRVRQLSVTGCVCAGACQAGTYSFDGLSPCTQCPLGFFQPQAGTSTCAECSSGQTTLARGATSANSCVDAGQYHIISPPRPPPVFLPCNSTSPIDSSLQCKSTSPTDSTIFMFGMLKFCFCNAPLVKKDAMFVMTFRVSLWSMFVDVFQLR